MTPTIRADLTLGTAFGLAVSAVFWMLILAPPRADVNEWLMLALAAAAGAIATAFRRRLRGVTAYAAAVATLLVSGPAFSCLAGGVATVAARILLRDGLEDLGTNDLSSPTGVGSARYTRLANARFIYETIINHD